MQIPNSNVQLGRGAAYEYFVFSYYTAGYTWSIHTTAETMRIACLQFAPQVGDVSNNMARAEAVLSKADSDDLENLDLMVLPEMAFSGMTPGGWLSSQTDFPRIQLQVARAHLAPR